MLSQLTQDRAARLLLIAARNAGALRASATRKETALHNVADAHLAKMTIAIRYAFARGRKALGKNKNVGAAVKAVKAALLDVLPATLEKVVIAGGEVVMKSLPKLKAAELRVAAQKLTMTFDAGDPNVAKWAREHTAELAKGISETTREAIAEAIANQAETGEDAYDEILAAVGDDARAELIARTETMAAANEGQRQSWDQAVEKGLLDEESKRVWIAAGDACPECDALDGEEAALDGEYPDDGGDGPPLHPNCRCTEGIAS